MPVLPQARSGAELSVKGRVVPFSFWPMRKSSRRYGLQSHLFASNPWAVIRQSIADRCPAARREAANAFIAQAEDFYRSASAGQHTSAKPLLLYYSFLNIAKAFILTSGLRQDLDFAHHGISEEGSVGQRSITAAKIVIHPTVPGKPVNVFDDFLNCLQGHGLAAKTEVKLASLLPQVVVGHRLWAAAAEEAERFVTIERVAIMYDAAAKELWLCLYLFADDLVRIGVGHGEMLKRARLSAGWREVTCPDNGARRQICFEQKVPLAYSHRPSDKVQELVDSARQELWATASMVPPYRRHYLYLAPNPEQKYVLPQVLSIYALIFYLGSITRYRPHRFEKIVSREFAALAETLVTDQPSQFLFVMASEFARREVVRPAIA